MYLNNFPHSTQKPEYYEPLEKSAFGFLEKCTSGK